MEYVSKNILKRRLPKVARNLGITIGFANFVDSLPPANVVEEKVGTWIEYTPEHGQCSECGNRVDLLGGKNHYWCSECGAHMIYLKAFDCRFYNRVQCGENNG